MATADPNAYLASATLGAAFYVNDHPPKEVSRELDRMLNAGWPDPILNVELLDRMSDVEPPGRMLNAESPGRMWDVGSCGQALECALAWLRPAQSLKGAVKSTVDAFRSTVELAVEQKAPGVCTAISQSAMPHGSSGGAGSRRVIRTTTIETYSRCSQASEQRAVSRLARVRSTAICTIRGACHRIGALFTRAEYVGRRVDGAQPSPRDAWKGVCAQD